MAVDARGRSNVTSEAAPATRIVTTTLASPLGDLIAGATSQGICLLEFTERRILEQQLNTLRSRFGGIVEPGANDHLASLRGEIRDYFAGTLKAFTAPLLVCGTPFEERVWTALQAIPYGSTMSYESLAQAVGCPSARAVGRANGMNRIAIVIPCHRVIGKDGSLVGYGGGMWRKQRLLELEGRVQPLLF